MSQTKSLTPTPANNDAEKPASKKQRMAEAIERLVVYRNADRLTIEQCAAKLGVSERTVNNYLATDEYREATEMWRQLKRENAISSIAQASERAVQTLVDLLDDPRSGHVRFEAAAKLLDLFGVQILPEDAKGNDDSDEYQQLLEQIAKRPQQTIINVYNQPPEAGGALPAALRGDVVDADAPDGGEFLPATKVRRLLSGQA